MRLMAGFRPDLLGELTALPRPLAGLKGREGRGGKRERGRGKWEKGQGKDLPNV